jgi:hypothetical protein
MRRFTCSLCAALLATAAPALANTDKEAPGAPCTGGPDQGTGNPCDGNNGNPSPEGNAGDKVKYDRKPDPFVIARPNSDSGAFIAQIGDGNRADIGQSANTQYARIDQDGDRNLASVTQSGVGAHYATVDQTGGANALSLAQSGYGAQVALLRQAGNGNSMLLSQDGGSIGSGLAAVQYGDGNTMALTQSGDGNQASLVQNGSNNAMSLSQTGGGNQLAWIQTGNDLSDLSISQTGGQALQVTQSN